jgi:hypothetical protein
MRVSIFVLISVMVLSVSCKRSGQNENVVNIDSIDLSDRENILSELDTLGAGIPIFYNMYLSVELSSLFETAGTVFTKDILNPTDNISDYMTSYKKAMNLGIYAVDLSYARVFEQYEVAGKYFSAMQTISEQLGIPSNYFESIAQRFEKNLTQKDSLISIANEVYYETEGYLRDNERFATASVIILGGWVEAMHIGTYVAIESRNVDIIERLVDQKYSLNNLLIMLSEYKSNEVVAEYIKKLEVFRDIFMSIDVDVSNDFDNNAKDSKEQIDKWLEKIKILQKEISKVRSAITR